MIVSRYESAFPHFLHDSHLKSPWGSDDGNFAPLTQVANSIIGAAHALLNIDVMLVAPFLGAGLVVDRNVLHTNNQPNNVALDSKHPRFCKGDPETKQYNGQI